MIPKIGSALSRFLEPLKPVKKTQAAEKSREDLGGGHGNLPFEKWKKSPEDGESAADQSASQESPSDSESIPLPTPGLRRSATPKHEEGADAPSPSPETKLDTQAGLTQVILEIQSSRADSQSGTAIQSYESGSREQKSGTRLPKGSMLDKKVG